MSVRGSHRHWREAHDSFTLALVHREQAAVIANWSTRAQTLSTKRGEMMAIEPGDVHVTHSLKLRAGRADFDVIRFAPQLIADAARELDISPQFHFASPNTSAPDVFDALQGLAAAVAHGEPLELECASARALAAVALRLGERRATVRAEPVRDYRLRRVCDYLRVHTAGRPALAELSEVAGLTPSRLCAVFKRSYGVTLGDYWNALRLAQATHRLQRGVPIKVLVGELGYIDESYFSRVFKRHYGVPPGAWMKSFLANGRRK